MDLLNQIITIIISSLVALLVYYIKKRTESKDAITRMARLFLHDMKRSIDLIDIGIESKKPIYSELTIIYNWKADVHILLPVLNKRETDALLSYYSKIDDLKKRQKQILDLRSTNGKENISNDYLSQTVKGFLYNSSLITEIETKELMKKLDRFS